VLEAALPREYKLNVQGWEKMYAEKRVVIVVAVVLVVCALLFCNADAVVEAKPASTTLTATTSNPRPAVNATPAVKPASTTLTATTSNPSPAVKQSFTLSGTLTANGTAVPNEQITLLSRQSSANQGAPLGTATTTANGSYSITVSIPTQDTYTLQATFYGDSAYSPAYGSVRETVGTFQPGNPTATTSNPSPAVKQSSTVGNPTATTSNPSPAVKQSSTVGTLTPSTVTIATSNSTPAVNQPFTLNGTLKAGTTPPQVKPSISAERTPQAPGAH
jgi:serine-aspartate repeat-containing protein C/D/E